MPIWPTEFLIESWSLEEHSIFQVLKERIVINNLYLQKVSLRTKANEESQVEKIQEKFC